MIQIISIHNLISHEQIDADKVKSVMNNILKCKKIRYPIIVEKVHYIILDGHHRVAALKKLHIHKVPAQLVSYADKSVKVLLRRKELMDYMIKTAVISNSKSGNLFPKKTTRHVFSNKIRHVNVQLSVLQ